MIYEYEYGYLQFYATNLTYFNNYVSSLTYIATSDNNNYSNIFVLLWWCMLLPWARSEFYYFNNTAIARADYY